MTTFQKCILVLIALGIGAYFYQGIAAREAVEQKYERFMESCVNVKKLSWRSPNRDRLSASHKSDSEIMQKLRELEEKVGAIDATHECELLWKHGSPTD